MDKKIIMFLYGPLDTDGRVLRCLDVLNKMGKKVVLISCNSRHDYSNDSLECVNLKINPVGLINYFRFVIYSLYYSFIHRRKISLFYLQDYYSTLIGYLISLFSRKKIIYDAHELLLRRKTETVSFRDKLFIHWEKKVIKRVFYIIAANEERMRILKWVYKVPNITFVLNITSATITPDTEFKKLDNTQEITMVYQGVLTEERNISFFINVLFELPGYVKLMLIGDGPSEQYYHQLVESLNLADRVIFTGRISNAEMLDELRRCHIGIITYPFTDLNNVYCSPNKIFEYAALCLPTLSTSQPFMEKIFNKYNIGETFEENNPSSFVSSFNSIRHNTSISRDDFSAFLADYNFNNESLKIEKVIDLAFRK